MVSLCGHGQLCVCNSPSDEITMSRRERWLWVCDSFGGLSAYGVHGQALGCLLSPLALSTWLGMLLGPSGCEGRPGDGYCGGGHWPSVVAIDSHACLGRHDAPDDSTIDYEN